MLKFLLIKIVISGSCLGRGGGAQDGQAFGEIEGQAFHLDAGENDDLGAARRSGLLRLAAAAFGESDDGTHGGCSLVPWQPAVGPRHE